MCSRSMFMTELAMFVSCGGVLLRVFVLTHIVMMGSLVMMVRGSRVVSGGLMMLFTRRVLR